MPQFSSALLNCIKFLRISVNSKLILFAHDIYSFLSLIILLAYSLVLKLSKFILFFGNSLVLNYMIIFANKLLYLGLLLEQLIFLNLQVLIIELLFFDLFLNLIYSVCLLVKFMLVFFQLSSCLFNIKELVLKNLNFALQNIEFFFEIFALILFALNNRVVFFLKCFCGNESLVLNRLGCIVYIVFKLFNIGNGFVIHFKLLKLS